MSSTPAFTVDQLISQQSTLHPDRIALVEGREHVTYAELERRSTAIGEYLAEEGVKEETRVCIVMNKSVELLVGMVGVMKSGGVFVPVDTSYPADRQKYMQEDSMATMMLVDNDDVSNENARTVNIRRLQRTTSRNDKSNSSLFSSSIQQDRSNNLVYILYTSGSTGRPKGVMTTHEGLLNTLNYDSFQLCLHNKMEERHREESEQRYIQNSSVCFDFSTHETFLPLLNGSCIVIPQQSTDDSDTSTSYRAEKDMFAVVESIEKMQITSVCFVPSVLSVVLTLLEEDADGSTMKKGQSVERYMCGGEALTTTMQRRLFSFYASNDTQSDSYSSSTSSNNAELTRTSTSRFNTIMLLDLYGPTETTIDTCYHMHGQRHKRDSETVGRAIGNMQLHLDAPSSSGPSQQGEALISGRGVARGYNKRASVTADKFIPFSKATEHNKQGEILNSRDH